MSGFELGLMRQRARGALQQKIRRGEVLTEVPVGYVRSEDNTLELTPDRQVQAAIRGVFAKFQELGSARQVLLWYRQEQIAVPFPLKGTNGTQVTWRLPIDGRIMAILQNPTYAGSFAYGRTTNRTVVADGRAKKTRGHRVSQEQWQVLIHNHHVGYITWDIYLKNQEMLKENAAMRGDAKLGPALLAGLLRCKQCGRKLHVAYSGVGGRVPRYHCRGGQINHGTPMCISFGGLRVDRAITAEVLKVLEPIAIEASLEAFSRAARSNNEKRSALGLSLEKARYEAQRSRRQFDAVDPENRLVAAELETRWNSSLKHVAEIEARLAEAEAVEEDVSPEERARLLSLGSDLHSVCNSPTACVKSKKRVLRTVLEEIIADVSDDPSEIVVWIHWAGGVHTQLRISRNRTGQHGRSTDREVVGLVRDLSRVCDDQSVTKILNRLGYRTGTAKTWTEARVRSLRSYHQIPVFEREGEQRWVTMEGAAKELGISPVVIRRLLRQKILTGRQVVAFAPWMIERSELIRPEIQTAAKAAREGRRPPRIVRNQSELPLK